MLYWEKKHDFVMRKNLSKLSRWAYSGLEVLEILFMGDEQAKLRWHLIEMTWGNVGVGKTLQAKSPSRDDSKHKGIIGVC